MPHAEEMSPRATTNGTMTNGTPLVNGDKPHSKVLSHLHSYPVVHDGVEYYKTHPYGAKSLSLVHQTYNRLVAPLHPYLQTPYSFLSPYLSRADELGDTGLNKVDSRFPIVKEDTNKLVETVQGYAYMPVKMVGMGREYVLSTWEDEYSKTTGQGYVKTAKALVSTQLKVGQDGYLLARDYMKKGKKEASKKAEEVQQ